MKNADNAEYIMETTDNMANINSICLSEWDDDLHEECIRKDPCSGCLWEDQCTSLECCDDYTPLNDDDIEYYNMIVKENTDYYNLLIIEQTG